MASTVDTFQQADYSDANSNRRRPVVWHIAGEDAHVRIPSLLRLRERGYDIGAVGNADPAPFANAGVPYYEYTLNRFISPWQDYKTRSRLHELLVTHKPDLVHAFSTKPAVLVPAVAKRAGIPVRIRTITGMGFLFSSSSPIAKSLRPVYRRFQKRASSASTFTVFQNTDDHQYFSETGLTDSHACGIIPGSGVDVARLTDSYAPDEEQKTLRAELNVGDRPVVLLIARLVRHKGVIEYMQAARLAKRAGSNAQFLLVGPLKTEGRQGVTREEIDSYADCVQYLGKRSDVPSLLSIADAFVLPTTYREGVPRVLLEAAAMGVALVTTDMPGCRDVVQHEETGLLVPPRNADAICAAVERLLSDRLLRNRVAANAFMLVKQKFDVQHIIDQYDALYRRFLSMDVPVRGSELRESRL